MHNRFRKILSFVLVMLFAVTLFGCTEADQDLAIQVLAGALQQQLSAQNSQTDAVPTFTPSPEPPSPTAKPVAATDTPVPDQVVYGRAYSTWEEVAEYIHLFNELPPNYIKKNDAMDLGWESTLGNLYEVTGGKSIGGDRFYNNDRKLPNKKGRKYYECDVEYYGGYRGAERLVYSNDGLIFYTKDHYATFTQLYGDLSK